MKTLDELFTLFCEHREQNGKKITENSYYYVRKFIEFSKNDCYTEYYDQEVFDDWCCKAPTETKQTFLTRVASIRQFLIFINRNGYAKTSIPDMVSNPSLGRIIPRKQKQTEKPFPKSCISDLLDEYIEWIKSIGKYKTEEHGHLIRFNKELNRRFPGASTLTTGMVDAIFAQRPNENANTCSVRNRPVRLFVEYALWKDRIDVELKEELPFSRKRHRIPHAFTNEELCQLFEAIDNIKPYYYEDDRALKFRKIQYATYFRLLYSSGMRTNEARMLKRSNVDFVNGVINIEDTKGYRQHRVALHPSMLELLKLYDEEMNKIIPDREPLFPDAGGGYHEKDWQANIFYDIWHKMSKEDARAYDLRSNYAVQNINSWKLGEPKWIDKFMYLSRSMGHVNLNSTAYYYQLVPMFREKLEQQSGNNLSKLLPDMNEFLDDLDDIETEVDS